MSKIENTTLAQNVRESALTNTIVHVDAPIMTIEDVKAALSVMDGVSDYDHACENDGTHDVWGTIDGEEFRIRVTTMPSARDTRTGTVDVSVGGIPHRLTIAQAKALLAELTAKLA